MNTAQPSLWSVRCLAGDSRGAAFFSLRVNLLSRQLHTYTCIQTDENDTEKSPATLSFFLRSFYHRYYDCYHCGLYCYYYPSVTIYHYRYDYPTIATLLLVLLLLLLLILLLLLLLLHYR